MPRVTVLLLLLFSGLLMSLLLLLSLLLSLLLGLLSQTDWTDEYSDDRTHLPSRTYLTVQDKQDQRSVENVVPQTHNSDFQEEWIGIRGQPLDKR